MSGNCTLEYGVKEIERDFDAGLSIDYIVSHYRHSKKIDAGEKIGEKKRTEKYVK